MFFDPFVPFPHQRPYGGWGRVEYVYLVLVHNLPEPVGVGICWNTFKHEGSGAAGQGTVNNVTMARYPSYVRCAEMDVLVPVIEYPLERQGCEKEVSCSCMKDSLGFPRAPACIKDEE